MGATLLVVGLVFAAAMLLSKKQIFNAKPDNAVASFDVNSENFYTLDSDEDGVYDWEEGLWGTNPNDTDSNKDGVSDAEDIASQKKAIQEENNLTDENGFEFDESNQTEAFARQLLSTASLASQQGGLSQESMNSFSTTLGSSIANANIPDQFVLSDIKMSSVTDATYKNSLAKVFEDYRRANISEISAIYLFVSGDEKASVDLEKLSKLYADIHTNLLKIEVPYAVAGSHLSMVNLALKLSIVFESMKSISEDPLSAVVGFKQYQEYSAGMQSVIARLTTHFNSSGV